MAGVHGKNAELRISSTEVVKVDVVMTPHTDVGLAAKGVFETVGDKNWKFAPKGDDDAVIVTYESPSGLVKTIDANSRRVHYSQGAVALPAADIAALLAGSVKATYKKQEMELAGNILGQDRSVEINIEAELVDTTVLNEEFRTFVEGIQGFDGTLEGLYVEPDRIKFAFASIASGVIPRFNLRMRPRPDKPDTFLQGQVIFPTFNITLAFDSAIERSIEFSGQGPLELTEDGLPFFPGL
ncbi:hypothetical protein LCGC14_2604710 [marine sediment metagenome]|uniref:Uncharacterized protein n=1 Tax=marine sediment metagenome TaxID=412755 RepID=A0A0F9A7Z3_9ZZZZ